MHMSYMAYYGTVAMNNAYGGYGVSLESYTLLIHIHMHMHATYICFYLKLFLTRIHNVMYMYM